LQNRLPGTSKNSKQEEFAMKWFGNLRIEVKFIGAFAIVAWQTALCGHGQWNSKIVIAEG
jgi:hypothetical protein